MGVFVAEGKQDPDHNQSETLPRDSTGLEHPDGSPFHLFQLLSGRAQKLTASI